MRFKFELFSGADNPMVMAREYGVVYTCNFNLVLYPFDVLSCLMEVEMLSATFSYLVFSKASNASYLGSKLLTEYEIGTPILHNRVVDEASNVVVEVPFARRMGYAFLNIYTPSFILLVIAYSTLYFRLNDFEARIMTALTSLLVMATLFAQVSNSLPKTSYFKMVDVWLLFCIVVTFLVIICHIFIDGAYTRDTTTASHLSGLPRLPIGMTRVSPKSSSSTSIDSLLEHKGWVTRSRGHFDYLASCLCSPPSCDFLVFLSRLTLLLVFIMFSFLYGGLIFAYRIPLK